MSRFEADHFGSKFFPQKINWQPRQTEKKLGIKNESVWSKKVFFLSTTKLVFFISFLAICLFFSGVPCWTLVMVFFLFMILLLNHRKNNICFVFESSQSGWSMLPTNCHFKYKHQVLHSLWQGKKRRFFDVWKKKQFQTLVFLTTPIVKFLSNSKCSIFYQVEVLFWGKVLDHIRGFFP